MRILLHTVGIMLLGGGATEVRQRTPLRSAGVAVPALDEGQ
jgi:hypothetical protein